MFWCQKVPFDIIEALTSSWWHSWEEILFEEQVTILKGGVMRLKEEIVNNPDSPISGFQRNYVES